MTDSLATRRAALLPLMYADETRLVQRLLERVALPDAERAQIVTRAQSIVSRARERRSERGLLEIFMQEFGLSTDEGLALMSLAEALLRVPDAATADNLIAEKIHAGSWDQRDGQSDSAIVNVAARALKLSTGVVELDQRLGGEANGLMRSLVNRLGEPVVRTAVRQAMRLMGNEFVLGRTIEEAQKRVPQPDGMASFDMLGEGARTADDAQRYFDSYQHAIKTTARASTQGLYAGHGVSVKLSALHPRYEYANRERVMREMLPRLKALALLARSGNIHMTIDAEEAARLELSLDLIEALARDPELADWQGLGLALQCYSKRATAVLDWLIALSAETKRRFMVRLVKGAYWDTEIKRAQEQGVTSYPVFTRKVTTDLSYLVCARKTLEHPDAIYPQFATHNAHTVAAIMYMAGKRRDFEFQRLHGMGELLYAAAREVMPDMPRVRIYAPVGAHKDLLAYLVRRLLENGANSSFVNRFMDETVPLEKLIEDPAAKIRTLASIPNPKIPLPVALYGAERTNSAGIDLSDIANVEPLMAELGSLQRTQWLAAPTQTEAGRAARTLNDNASSNAAGSDRDSTAHRQPASPPTAVSATSRANGTPIPNPANRDEVAGFVVDATVADVERAVAAAVAAHPHWDRTEAAVRARILERVAVGLETERDRFLSLLVREAGKTLGDAVAEIREAVDFCRYYAREARARFGSPTPLPGPTGEQNLYSLHGRGVFVCISPWNFPLAIFLGQVAAALAAGNTVLAKPAEQTPLIAAATIDLLHRCGVPTDVAQLLPGLGEVVGAALVADERIAGVTMTGSTATAKLIAKALANRRGPIIPLIAETGGQNAMFVDSTALPEQVVDDVIRSAFHSAGQRCSALRVLYLQQEVADSVIDMIKGAMNELTVGNPAELATDVGPVIDKAAQQQLALHVAELKSDGRLLHTARLTDAASRGTFVAPCLFEIESVAALKQEHFGPLLHVVRYRTQDLERHLEQLRATGFGLTLGIHTRIEAVSRSIFEASTAGNVYINRNMIGAVVGVQPFGGHGLSGTGPKAGGPMYLQRFATERVLTINTAATGGNVALLRLETEES